jgi:predicted transcriptional regulator
MPDTASSFRLSVATRRRLDALSSRLNLTKTDVIGIAITHLLSCLERDQTIWLELPSEPKGGPPEAQAGSSEQVA